MKPSTVVNTISCLYQADSSYTFHIACLIVSIFDTPRLMSWLDYGSMN